MKARLNLGLNHSTNYFLKLASYDCNIDNGRNSHCSFQQLFPLKSTQKNCQTAFLQPEGFFQKKTETEVHELKCRNLMSSHYTVFCPGRHKGNTERERPFVELRGRIIRYQQKEMGDHVLESKDMLKTFMSR